MVFRTSTVQTWVTGKIAHKFSEELQTEIEIQGVDISWFLNVVLEGVSVNDQHHRPLFKAKIIEFGLDKYDRKNNKIILSEFSIDSLFFALRTYKNEEVINFQFIVDYFANSDTTVSEPITFGINNIQLTNSRFIIDDENIEHQKVGMDFNHLDVQKLNTEIHNFRIDTGYFFASIDSLSAKDDCGFDLQNLKGDIMLGSDGLSIEHMLLHTPKSNISSDFKMDYNQWADWEDFLNLVKFNSQLDSSTIDFSDIAYFAPDLDGIKLKLIINGKIKGSVANLKLRNFKLEYGKITAFEGKINLRGLPEIDKAFIDVKAENFITTNQDIKGIRLPGNQKIELPDNFSNLQEIKIKGRFTGFYNNFVANASFNTGLGNMSTDIQLKPLEDTNALSYNGKIKLSNFDIGKILGIDGISNLSINGSIDGKGLDEDAQANLNINISNIRIAKYNYRDSKINGNIKNRKITATIASNDSIFKLFAKGSYDFSDTLPKYSFYANVENARIGRLFLSESDTFGTIGGQVFVNATGNNVDNIIGNINIDSLSYNHQGTHYYGGNFKITSMVDSAIRDIDLKSKYIDGNIHGKFKFVDLGKIYPYVIKNFIPVLLNGSDEEQEIVQKNIETAENLKFNYDFKLKNTKDLSEIFYPDLKIANKASLSGIFDAGKNELKLDFHADDIDFTGKKAYNLAIDISSHLDTFYISSTSDRIQISDSISLDSVIFTPIIYRDSAQIRLLYGKKEDHDSKLNLNAGIHFLKNGELQASINQLDLIIKDTLWALDDINFIEYKPHYLKINNFRLASDNNSLEINGLLTENIEDKMNIKFKDFELAFLNFYLSRYLIQTSGKLTGSIEVASIWEQINFLSDFKIKGFNFNNVLLGNADIISLWNEARQAITLNMSIQNFNSSNQQIKPLDISGFYYPYHKKNNLDFKLKINEFPLASIQPFLSSFSSKLEGFAKGSLAINGLINEPIITGKLNTKINTLKIDYLNTSYSLDDNLVFYKDYFGYENVKIHDKKYSSGINHTGNFTFKLHHDNFDDLKLEVAVKAHNLEMINTTKYDNDLFYGYAVGDGEIKINGPLNDLFFDINLKPLKDSKLAIPMSETSEVQSNEFIKFVILDTTKLKKKKPSEEYNMSMNLNFDMTPDATIQLVMDETLGDIITVNGSGNIRIVVDRQMNVNMYGSYKVSKGDYLFTMRNILNKHFYIEPGGTIQWEGDILDAKIDLRAKYRADAKLYDLLQSVVDSSNAETYKRRSKVFCVIDMKGSLISPNITFDIEVPEESNATQELVKMVLYANSGNANQDLMNKNFISLIMFGSFQAPGGYTQATDPKALASNATEALANQLGYWLNKMSDDVDIGFTWDAGDDVTTQEMTMALSYQAFNDRLLIDGKFGAGGDIKTSENSTRIVGDLNVEYKITKDGNFSAKVFNRTNYEDPLSPKAPYTQGAGIVYRKEFDTLKELFERVKKAEAVLEEEENKDTKESTE